MFKKILSTALAMAMVLSMAVSTSAALGKPGSSTPSTKFQQQKIQQLFQLFQRA